MRAIYIDTEFTQLSLDRRLISLALVDAAGAEFYVELSDGWSAADCSAFVDEIVLPQLDLARHGRPRTEAGPALHAFLANLGEVEIVGDALAWDWPLLLELLGPLGLPANVLGCRQVDDPLGELPSEDIPHHALLDARLLCTLCETDAPD
ncbi:hypothetical protein SAMN05216229_104162 [Geopseudomonas sagittaria]|uniref:Uncharacterized protein n=1 Tax=Geopseudomonas sagittaria TaxID=1135990 RepID=A0A1I5S321_9GAMM|nr:hypothetical protein [Pseudomonas sagittaria]SFP65099.1 hypothetical protein SAMN05216229_104162 [Pseudomonas sagittaria]